MADRPNRATFLHNHADAVLACDFFIVVTATFQRLYVFVLLDISTRRIVCSDGIFAPAVDEALRSMSLQVLKTPVRAPQANARCERFIGTARRECLDWMLPLNERHLRSVLAEWISHYNRERPHSAWGPGFPHHPSRQATLTGHRLPAAHRVVASTRLGGLHHHYTLEPIAA